MTEVADIQKPFAKWLRDHQLPFVQARSDQRSTVASGWPDFTICYQGRVLLIETKTKGGRVTKGQFDMHAKLASAGCPVTVAYSLEECVSAVQTWLEASEAPTEAPVRENGHPNKGFRIVNWRGVETVVSDQGKEWKFVRLARPDDLLSIPRA